MQQHPVPQHISSYEFKLVGDMTLKQFFQLSGGIVISFVIYATPLPGFIKWPLILFFAGLGAALAFVPFQDRPLSTWIVAFFRAIYMPTLYTNEPDTAESIFASVSSTPQVVSINQNEAYLSSLPQPEVVQNFENAEQNFFQRVSSLFHNTGQAKQPTSVLTSNIPLQTTPATTSGQTSQQGTRLVTEQVFSNPDIEQKQEDEERLIGIPLSNPVKIEPLQKAAAPQSQQSTTQTFNSQPIKPVFTSSQNQQSTAQQAVFTPEATPPAAPERPNTIVGQVLTSEGKIVEGAIMEIHDTNKRPVRALRTNKVGHFMTATPLADGEYEIEVEKENLTFDPVRFLAEGRLIPPILIKAKA